MIIVVYVAAIVAIIVGAFLLITAYVGAASCRESIRKSELVGAHELGVEDAYGDVGVSIVVSGVRSMAELEALMSLSYIRYELVLVVNFETEPLIGQMVRRYSLVRVDKQLSGELSCGGIRSVYHSRERRYNRLVLVDKPFTSLCDAYNCGVNLCSYDVVMVTNSWCRFDQNLLHTFVTELFEHWESHRTYAIGGFKVAQVSDYPIRVVDTITRMVVLGAGMSRMSQFAVDIALAPTVDLGQYAATQILFDRQTVIDAGGYKDDCFPDGELYSRIRASLISKGVDAIAVFVPQVVAFDQQVECEGECQGEGCCRVPTDKLTFVEKLMSKSFSQFFLLLGLLVVILSILTGSWNVLEVVGYIAIIIYFAIVGAGALSLMVADKLLLDKLRYRRSTHLVGVLFVYPFYLLWRLMPRKNFVQ